MMLRIPNKRDFFQANARAAILSNQCCHTAGTRCLLPQRRHTAGPPASDSGHGSTRQRHHPPIHTSMAPAGDRASAPRTKGKGRKPKTKSVGDLVEPPLVPASTTTSPQTTGSPSILPMLFGIFFLITWIFEIFSDLAMFHLAVGRII